MSADLISIKTRQLFREYFVGTTLRFISDEFDAAMPTLTKETLKELKLVPDGVPDSARGSDVIKRLLSNHRS